MAEENQNQQNQIILEQTEPTGSKQFSETEKAFSSSLTIQRQGKGKFKMQIVSFKNGDEEFGVDIMRVQEIIRIQTITKVPQMPKYIEGIINLRGNVIPVIDLRKKFELEVKPFTEQTRIVVVNIDNRVVGFIVDSVHEVLRLTEEQIGPAPEIISGISKKYLKAIGKLEKRLIILLDLNQILTDDEKSDLSNFIK